MLTFKTGMTKEPTSITNFLLKYLKKEISLNKMDFFQNCNVPSQNKVYEGTKLLDKQNKSPLDIQNYIKLVLY